MTRPLVCDTSGILAALDTADPDHAACAEVLRHHPGPLLLSPLILAELDHLVRSRLGVVAARRLAADVAAGAYRMEPLSNDDVEACLGVDEHYADLGLGLADASLVVIAARADTTTILSLDHRHLRAVRAPGGTAFQLLPADA